MLIFVSITKYTDNVRVRKVRHKLKKMFLWNGILSIFNENYLLISIGCFVNFYFHSNYDTTGKKISLVVASILCLVVVIYPVFVVSLLMKKYKKLFLKHYKRKFGSLYLQFRFTSGKTKVLEPFVSAMRRLVLVLAFVYLYNWPTF